jgi:hypothetical protein
MHLKKLEELWELYSLRKGTTSRVMVASRLRVSFWLDGITSPGKYGWYFYNI